MLTAFLKQTHYSAAITRWSHGLSVGAKGLGFRAAGWRSNWTSCSAVCVMRKPSSLVVVFPQQSRVITVRRAACDKSSVLAGVTPVLLMRQSQSCKVLLIHLTEECLFFKLMPSSRMVTGFQTPSLPCGDELISVVCQRQFLSSVTVPGVWTTSLETTAFLLPRSESAVPLSNQAAPMPALGPGQRLSAVVTACPSG